MENSTDNVVNSRRSFLKKAAYSAPAILALGALSAPISAQASTFTHKLYTGSSADGTHEHIADIEVYGDSGPGVLYEPAGGKITFHDPDNTIEEFSGTRVIDNDDRYFDFAKQYFNQITTN